MLLRMAVLSLSPRDEGRETYAVQAIIHGCDCLQGSPKGKLAKNAKRQSFERLEGSELAGDVAASFNRLAIP
jgi:hypothetical protein